MFKEQKGQRGLSRGEEEERGCRGGWGLAGWALDHGGHLRSVEP